MDNDALKQRSGSVIENAALKQRSGSAIENAFAAANINSIAPCSRTLGFELVSLDIPKGETVVKFEALDTLFNPMGSVQGGMLAAMLDDAMGMLAMVKLAGRAIATTIDLNVQYLRPIRKGEIIVKARIVSMGRNTIFMEAELFDNRQKLAARAITSLAIIRNNKETSE